MLDKAQLQAKLEDLLTGVRIDLIEEDKELGMFRVLTTRAEELFITLDGKYFIIGDKHVIQQPTNTTKGGLINLSALDREKRRLAAVQQVSTDNLIIFPAIGKRKAWVLVFTDIDCGYCRKLHREMAEINKLGIEVRYAAFPRSGLDGDSYRKIVEVWCAEDPLKAMTDAKNGKKVVAEPCSNPVKEHFDLGIKFGVRGTPTMFASNGKTIGGYLPAQQLAQRLGI